MEQNCLDYSPLHFSVTNGHILDAGYKSRSFMQPDHWDQMVNTNSSFANGNFLVPCPTSWTAIPTGCWKMTRNFNASCTAFNGFLSQGFILQIFFHVGGKHCLGLHQRWQPGLNVIWKVHLYKLLQWKLYSLLSVLRLNLPLTGRFLWKHRWYKNS